MISSLSSILLLVYDMTSLVVEGSITRYVETCCEEENVIELEIDSLKEVELENRTR